MTATPTILANGVALAAIGQAVESSSLAVGAPLALTLASTAGYSAFAWVVLSRPFGSTATLTSETGFSTSITTDKPGRYRFRGSANGGEVRRDVEVIVARSPGRGLRKATGTDKLADLVTKYNALADEMDLSAKVFNAKAYGATGDGTTDDTAAIQAAIDAAITSAGGYAAGATVYLPEGQFAISDTLTIANVSGLRFRGAGNATALIWARVTAWAAGEYRPAISVESCQLCEIADFTIQVPSARLSVGIRMTTQTGGYPSSRNWVRRVIIAGSGTFDEGALIGGTDAGVGRDANNDYHTFEDFTVQGYRRFGLRIDNTQCYDIGVSGASIFTATQLTTTGSVQSGGTSVTVQANKFSADDVGTYIEIAGAGAAGGLLRTTITDAPSSTSITIADAASTTVVAAVLTYGGQAAVAALRGNIVWFGRGTGSNLDATFLLGATGSSPHQIKCVNDEASRKFIRAPGPRTGGKGIFVDGFRFSGDGVISVDRNVIDIGTPGEIEIANGFLGDKYTTADCRVYWYWSPANRERGRFSLRNVAINGESAANAAALFPGQPPTDVVNCAWTTSVADVPFGNIERDTSTVSGATSLPMVWPATKTTVTNTTAFTFVGMPVGAGSTRRVHVIHTGGPHAITWPTHTVVGSAFSNTGDDWFEFWTDGTTLWGKQL